MEQQVVTYASRLAIENKRVISKATELCRLASIRCNGSGSLAITLSSRIVVCLDLASTLLDETLDKTHAAKLAGVSRKVYNNVYKTYEALLNASKPISVKELAVFVNCIGSTENLAEKLLRRFERGVNQTVGISNDKIVDVTKPQYPAAALYVACRHSKVKISKEKLLSKASINKGMFDKLCRSMEVHLKQLQEIEKKAKESKSTDAFLCHLDKYADEYDRRCQEKQLSTNSGDKGNAAISYEEWKKKILSADDT